MSSENFEKQRDVQTFENENSDNWKKSGCKNRNSILKIDKATAMTPTNLKVNVGTVRLSLRTRGCYVSTSDADSSEGFCLFPACLRVYEKKSTQEFNLSC